MRAPGTSLVPVAIGVIALLASACTSSDAADRTKAWCDELRTMAERARATGGETAAWEEQLAKGYNLFDGAPEAVREPVREWLESGPPTSLDEDLRQALAEVEEAVRQSCDDFVPEWIYDAPASDPTPSAATTPTPRGAGVRADDVLSTDALPTQGVVSLFAFLPPLEPTDLCELVGLDRGTAALITDAPSEQLVPDAAAEGSRLACVWSVGEREASSGTAPPDLLEVGAARLGPDTRMDSMVDPDTLATTPAGWTVSEEPSVTPSGRARMTYVDLWSNADGAHVWAGASDRLENPSATARALLDHVLEHLAREKP